VLGGSPRFAEAQPKAAPAQQVEEAERLGADVVKLYGAGKYDTAIPLAVVVVRSTLRRLFSRPCWAPRKRAFPPRRPIALRKESKVNEDPFAERDGCGLTLDDWASFLGLTPDTY
jgi:hypothetical protein